MKPGNPNWVNQDSYLEKHLRDGLVLVGIFDGHGNHGAQISNRIKNLFAEAAHSLGFAKDMELHGVFQKAFAHVAAQVQADGSAEHSGATATLALVDANVQQVSIAHVGDCTALLITPSGGIAYQSADHRPTDHNEAVRLQAHGSQIVGGRLRHGELTHLSYGFARSIGDFTLAKYGVTPEPDISCQLPFEPGSTLIIASDGVWDALPKDVVASRVLVSAPQEAANLIVKDAYARWASNDYRDDITALIVKAAPADVHAASATVPAQTVLQAAATSAVDVPPPQYLRTNSANLASSRMPASTQPAPAQLAQVSRPHSYTLPNCRYSLPYQAFRAA
jgi:serine/threonine protein phosphatase PrpC